MRAFEQLLVLARAYVAHRGARRVRRAFVPEPSPDPARDAEYGLLELDDGSAGLYYAWMGATQAGMAARFPPAGLAGQDALALAEAYAAGDDAVRSLASAALNALTASLWRACGYAPPPAESSFGLTLAAGDSLGMIGNFPSLVRQACARGIPVTVVERKAHMVMDAPGVRITLDPRALEGCNKIVCTAATLLNDTMDDMLAQCPRAAEIAVVGPTAGCFPEPLFARGVSVIGGTLIADAESAARHLAARENLGRCARRYTLTPACYSGTARLLASLPRTGR